MGMTVYTMSYLLGEKKNEWTEAINIFKTTTRRFGGSSFIQKLTNFDVEKVGDSILVQLDEYYHDGFEPLERRRKYRRELIEKKANELLPQQSEAVNDEEKYDLFKSRDPL